MACIDANFLVGLDRRDGAALAKMQELEEKGDTVYITAVTAAEFFRGAYGSKNRMKALDDARNMIKRFSILDLDYESARIWGELSYNLKSDTIGDRDLFIAGIAIANRQALLTRDVRHFERVPDLTVESW